MVLQVSVGQVRIPPQKGGAIESYIFEASKRLSYKGYQIIILDRKYSKLDPLQEMIDGVKIIRLNANRFRVPILSFSSSLITLSLVVRDLLNQFSFANAVTRFLNKESENFDLILLHYSVSGFILTLRKKNLRNKMIYTSHTARRAKEQRSFLDRLAIRIENELAQRVSRIVVSTEKIRKEILRAIKKNSKDVVAIPTACVDTFYFTPHLEVDEIRQRYNLSDKRVILFVGRITRHKGIDYLIRAFKLVKEACYEDVKLMLIGPAEEFGIETVHSPYSEELLNLIRDLELEKDVHLIGSLPREDLRKLYVACDIFVLPSLMEASPLVISEAMASGKPVIATGIGSTSLQIKDGWNGFIVKPGNEKQLAEKMKYLLENLMEIERMGRNSREYAMKEFSWERMIERLLNAYLR